MNSRYQILGEINQGGVGVVLKAYDTKLQRHVAIKRFLSAEQRAAMGHMEGDLLKEASTLSALQHPNIVSIYDVNVDSPEGPEVIMEYLNGQDLEQAVAQAALTLEDFYQVAQQTLDALSNAHRMNLLHRDIKPSNIQVTWLANGKFVSKFVDFGLAKFFEKPSKQTVRHDGTVMGSIYYMAPEQFERQPLDNRSDIYSLGCVFYFALTMHRPFQGETVHDVINAHLHGRAPRMRDYREDIPAELEKWVEWMMRREPDHRPGDAEISLGALRKIILGKPADEVPGIAQLRQSVSAAPMKGSRPQPAAGAFAKTSANARPGSAKSARRPAHQPVKKRARWILPATAAAAIGTGLFFAFSGGKPPEETVAQEKPGAKTTQLLSTASREAELQRTKEQLADAQARLAVETASPARTASTTPASAPPDLFQPPGNNLFLWLDAARNTKADSKGKSSDIDGPVGEWHDRSSYGGSGRFQYTRSSTKDKEDNYPSLRMAGGNSSFAQPRHAVSFDGKGDCLVIRDRDKTGDPIGTSLDSGSLTILMMYRSKGGDAPDGLLTARSGDTMRWSMGIRGDGIVAGPAGNPAPVLIPGTEKEFRIASLRMDGGSGSASLALVSRDGKRASRDIKINPGPSGEIEMIRMGASDGSATKDRSVFGGEIAEVLIYDKALAPSALSEAENYLRQKYFGATGPTVTVN
jgi:serine/threonine protein kinase